MKHAYLIIAHNEFEVLSSLLELLDDERNDIYIHFDKKLSEVPDLSCKRSALFVIEHRVDVRWGTYSQIEAEYLLMSAAFHEGYYSFYHIISGVHLPLRNQDQIHAFFDKYVGQTVLQMWPENNDDIEGKLRRYNIITKHFMDFGTKAWTVSRFLWKSANYIQKTLKMKRNMNINFKKSDQWVSLSNDAVRLLLNNTGMAKRIFKYTFCGDEYFVATLLSLFNSPIVSTNSLLKVEFDSTSPRIFSMTDYECLMSSGCLFARKFSSSKADIINCIKESILSIN